MTKPKIPKPPPTPPILQAIADAARDAHTADTRLRDIVAEARRQGWSWAQIAEPLGVTRQSAHERFRDHGA